MLTPKSIYLKAEQKLEPAQDLVSILLIAIILISGYFLLINKSNTARTAWVTYMFMP